MNETKICPLLSIADEDDSLIHCQGDRCAWYVPPAFAGMEGHCAIQMLGIAAPELVQGVRSL